ncbi:MAG TPA: transposase [Thiolapillus brandeum]|uniref:Transposase n=1 Tax=Thiolapillus brandeum TaxID=1076588 RepID=A0A831RVU0_9GAMM|nr:transposase [Thiolapillus brandeum]
MIRLSDIIESFEDDFLAQYEGHLLPSHLKALETMKRCRNSLSLQMQAQCSECDRQIRVPHSCGHRHCPHCQHHESEQWLQRQLKKQVPAEYFLVTFTLPAELRSVAFRHQKGVYQAMIQCGWETLRTFTQNDSRLKGSAGAVSVLHTHSRRLDYHPHVHWVVPAAAVDAEKQHWRTKQGYLFNQEALAKVFRAKMLDTLVRKGLTLPTHCPQQWVVDCKSVGSGEKALVYLGRYLYRGVIREQDILACENGQVTFRYRNAQSDQWERRTVSATQFLWLVLQHVLPKGFRRARNFGFLHPNSKRLIGLLQYLTGIDPNRALAWLKVRPKLTCPCCGAQMIIVRTRIPPRSIPSLLPQSSEIMTGGVM